LIRPYVPDLNELSKLSDEFRLYAIIGVLMSLSAGFELAYFELFRKASGMNADLARKVFYKVRSDEARQGMAEAAVQHHLAKHPELLAQWNTLRPRMGEAAHRNLVGHNPVKKEQIIMLGDVFAAFAAYQQGRGAPPPKNPITRHRVVQDPVQVGVGLRKHMVADFDTLKDACGRLDALHDELVAFVQSWPKSVPAPPPPPSGGHR